MRALHGHFLIRQLYLSGVWLGVDQKEIGLCAQNMLTILGSTKWGNLFDHLMSTRIFTFDSK